MKVFLSGHWNTQKWVYGFNWGFEWRDMWLGFFPTRWVPFPNRWNLFICVIPCFPLHLWFEQRVDTLPGIQLEALKEKLEGMGK